MTQVRTYLDVNVGLPEIDECSTMEKAVKAISAAVNLPLQIDSSDPVTTERALRIYNGKPMVNSVNGKEESIKSNYADSSKIRRCTCRTLS